jgi:hypothetical protein
VDEIPPAGVLEVLPVKADKRQLYR